MTDLMRYAAALSGQARGKHLPPVHKWNPEFCGDINLVIKRDGTWFYEGSPIGRAPLVRLFSTVLKREGDRYFLVTPVEKLGIEVEDVPFLAVLMRREGPVPSDRLVFTTNVGDAVEAGLGHEIVFRRSEAATSQIQGKAPYIHVRAGLWARVARAVFYDLVALGETRDANGEQQFGVASGTEFFPFGPAHEVFVDE